MTLNPGWKSAWRWFSMQAMFLAGALTASWAALPAPWVAALPSWAFPVVIFTVLVLGAIGRVVQQSPPPA